MDEDGGQDCCVAANSVRMSVTILTANCAPGNKGACVAPPNALSFLGQGGGVCVPQQHATLRDAKKNNFSRALRRASIAGGKSHGKAQHQWQGPRRAGGG